MRAVATGRLANRLEIDILLPEQGALLLLRRAGLMAPDAPLEHASSQVRDLAVRFTAETLHDLASFREKQGNDQEALVLYQRAFAICEQALGPEHPKTSATRERLTALRQVVSSEATIPFHDDPPLEQQEPNS